MLTTFTVNSIFDGPVDLSDNVVTLRDAITAANNDIAVSPGTPAGSGADTIEFDSSLSGATITIFNDLYDSTDNLAISDDLTVTGLGANQLTVDGSNGDTVFYINPGVTAAIDQLKITGFSSVGRGGGIYNAGTLSITQSIISGNSILGNARGGGIFNAGTLTLTQTTVSGNSVEDDSSDGGGISNIGTLTITQSIISDNSALGARSNGGGIFNSGTLTLTQSVVSGNSADDGGGIYNVPDVFYANSGILTIIQSTISDNLAVRGGGIYNGTASFHTDSSHLTISHSTISGNSASEDGGGIYNGINNYSPDSISYLTVSHSTIIGNSANRNGGGLWIDSDAALTHMIVAGNTAIEDGDEIYGESATVTLGSYNLIGDASKSTAEALSGVSAGVTDILATSDGATPTVLSSILDTALADNGGPTRTHALVPGSPAINAGDPEFDEATTPFDQRGEFFERIHGGRVDIGALELQDHESPIVTGLESLTTITENSSVELPLIFSDNLTPPEDIEFIVDGAPNLITSISGSGAERTLTITPVESFRGVATLLVVRLADLDGNSVVGYVNFIVNDLPVALDDAYETDEDTTLVVAGPGVLNNDLDEVGHPLTTVFESGPSNGTLTFSEDGSFTYTPDVNFSGSDSFTYKATDGLADSNVATVNITVHPVNDLPISMDDAYETNEDTPLLVEATGVLANDTDLDGDPLTAILESGLSHGELTLDDDGSFTYTPNTNFFGSDSFTYRASDGLLESETSTVSITVDSVNDSPSFALGSDQSAPEDAGPQSVAGFATGMSAGPANESGQSLTFLVSTDYDALFASLPAIDATTGELSYTPTTDASGMANVSVRLMDDGGTANGGVDTSFAQNFAITVLSPTEQADYLIGEVQMLLDAGALNRGQSIALNVKLNEVQQKYAVDRTQVALNVLHSFTNQVQALVQGGELTTEQGQSLLNAAEELKTSLETTTDEEAFDAAFAELGTEGSFLWL